MVQGRMMNGRKGGLKGWHCLFVGAASDSAREGRRGLLGWVDGWGF